MWSLPYPRTLQLTRLARKTETAVQLQITAKFASRQITNLCKLYYFFFERRLQKSKFIEIHHPDLQKWLTFRPCNVSRWAHLSPNWLCQAFPLPPLNCSPFSITPLQLQLHPIRPLHRLLLYVSFSSVTLHSMACLQFSRSLSASSSFSGRPSASRVNSPSTPSGFLIPKIKVTFELTKGDRMVVSHIFWVLKQKWLER